MQVGFLSPLSSPDVSLEKKRSHGASSSEVSPFSSPEKKARPNPGLRVQTTAQRKLNFDFDLLPQFDVEMLNKISLKPIAKPGEIDVEEEVLDSERERVEHEREALTALVDTSPKKKSTTLVTKVIKAITSQEFDKLKKALIEANKAKTSPLTLLESVQEKFENSAQRPLLQRIIQCTNILRTSLDELPEKKLTELQAVKIALYAEEHLSQLTETTYKPKSKILARTLVLAPVTRQLLVLSKKAAILQVDGGFKKITSCGVFTYPAPQSPNQQVHFSALDFARLTNKADDEIDEEQAEEEVGEMKKEVVLAQRFNRDVLLSVAHESNAGKAKFDWFEERYENNLHDFFFTSKKLLPPLLDAEQLAVLLKVVETLKAMHDQGFVHNDLNAKNILLKKLANGSLKVKLSDFGKTYNLTKEYPRADEGSYGSAIFTSPEHFVVNGKLQDRLAQGKAEDIYALGCLLYGMIYRQEMPWALCVQRGIDGSKPNEKSEALDRQMQCYEKLLLEKTPDAFKLKLYTLMMRLLDPNPHARLTVDEVLIYLKN